MADNITLNTGTGGDVCAADDIGGAKYQRVKLVHGADGVNAGDVSSTNPFPVIVSPRDAFGRVRVSTPEALFDSKMLHDKAPLLWDESITNTTNAVSAHSVAAAAVLMHVETNDSIVRQTFQRMNYQPGKSQLIMQTGVLGAGGAGVTARIGYFDANNGLFFQLSNTTLSVVIRKAAADTVVNQTSWNLDKMNGTGASGATIDTTKAQIFVIDFEWLGTGSVRFGFVINGEIVYCHKANHANVATSVYMSTPCLPLRYEIASTNATAEMLHICSTVISEGGTERHGFTHYISTGNAHVDANAEGTLYAVVGVRLKTTTIDRIVKPERISIVATTADPFEWSLFVNPTVAGAFTYGDHANSAVQFALGATANTITNGYEVTGGFVAQQADASPLVNAAVWLGADIAGTPNEFVLCVRPLGGNADIHGGIELREY